MTTRRRGLSTILTTIIILVASVVLGSGVVLYGSSLFQGETQQASISVQGAKVWVNATDANDVSWGAAAIRNSGDRILSVDQILVRGTSVPFTSWYSDTDQTRVTTDNFQTTFALNDTSTNGVLQESLGSGGSVTTACSNDDGVGGTNLQYDFDGDEGGGSGDLPTICMDQRSGPMSLNPGERAIVFFRVPDGTLSPLDSGASTSLNVFAGTVSSPQTVTVANP